MFDQCFLHSFYAKYRNATSLFVSLLWRLYFKSNFWNTIFLIALLSFQLEIALPGKSAGIQACLFPTLTKKYFNVNIKV